MLLPQIPGETLSARYQSELQQKVGSLFNCSSNKFPGAQPISFARHHIDQELLRENYFVSEKADGIRVLLFTHINKYNSKPETFLIDRKNNYYFNNFHLPGPDNIILDNTILDAELVLDVDKDGKKQLYLLLFDCIVYLGENLCEKPYHKRLGVTLINKETKSIHTRTVS